MPIYDYYCQHCKHQEEDLMTKADAKVKCPVCRGIMKHMIGCPPTHFKGSGFYHTDYRKPRNGIVERELKKYNIDY